MERCAETSFLDRQNAENGQQQAHNKQLQK
jgi:hypothetical protein